MQQEDCAKPQFIMTNANTSAVAVKFCLLPWKAEKNKTPSYRKLQAWIRTCPIDGFFLSA